jgi:hypothetical protein
MVNEIRIYYESLEQGANYIKPIIEKALQKNKQKTEVKLIKLKGSYSYYSKNVAPVVFWKDPDVLVTIIINEVEYPLLLIEFSNAVFTEDHELQRFDGLVAAAENNCIYVKISPITKQSQNQHGGNIDFDYVGPFSLIYKKLQKMFFHFDWKCDEKGIVEVDENFMSCPKEIPNFDIFISEIIKFFANMKFNEETWIKEFEKSINDNDFVKEWKQKLENFEQPSIEDLSSTRTSWDSVKKELTLKLNRFGHAMDPERGMLSYYGVLFEKTASKMLFNPDNNAWYKDTPKEKEIKKYIDENGLEKGFDFLYCFMLGSGLYGNDSFKKLVKSYEENNDEELNIDLTNFLKENYINLNKAMRTIFKNSIFFIITNGSNEKKVKLTWNNFDRDENYDSFPDISKIKERDCFDEDDVTYITVHNILKKNKFKILAVSYPGAQADRVVLVAPGTGRRQQRRYIDIIAYLPKKCTNLQENKGKYSPSQIQKEITELSKYKTEEDYKQAINSFIDRFNTDAPKLIKIGVGFWANSKFTVDKLQELDISNLDYFVYLTPNRENWHIWSTGSGAVFELTTGKIYVPQTYEVFETCDRNNTASLEEFF